jgi:hypothetical protein
MIMVDYLMRNGDIHFGLAKFFSVIRCFESWGLSRLMKGVKEVMVYDDVGGKVYVLTMTRLVCFPARLRSAYGIGLLHDSSGSYSSVYSGLEVGGVVSSGGVRRPDVVE